MTKAFPAVSALVAAVSLAACGGGGSDRKTTSSPPPASGGGSTVILKNIQFSPSKLTVKAGSTVRWEWKESVTHNVHGADFKSDLQSKGTFEHTFDKAGDYSYKCDVHPTMTGTITVQ